MNCRKKRKSPSGMIAGSATTDRRFMYFTSKNSTSVFQYEWRRDEWETLSSCPYENSSLAIIAGALTTIGGVDKEMKPTKELFSLKDSKWTKLHPEMNVARYSAAVVGERHYTFVIGGNAGEKCFTTKVELFSVNSKIWFEITDLPQPLKFPSVAICGTWIHVAGCDGSVFSCSLQDLPASGSIEGAQVAPAISWNEVCQLPVTHSTTATLGGALVTVGGQSRANKESVDSIYQLVEGEWKEICQMSSKRFSCLIVAPSPKNLMIVGGFKNNVIDTLDIVEECSCS